MKNNVMPSIVRMEKEILEQLVKEVKETVATDVNMNKSRSRSFSVVDLWDLRRGKRSSRRAPKQWEKWEI